jgi:hypothetical protein
MWKNIVMDYNKSSKFDKLVEQAKKEKEGKMDEKAVVPEIIRLLFWSRDQTHLWHLQTESYAEHTALNGYYDMIVELTDRLIEAIMGKYGRPKGGLKRFNDIVAYSDSTQLMKHFEMMCEECYKFTETFDDCEPVKNVLVDISEELYKIKYLITLK